MLRWNGISWTERTFYTAAKGDLLRIFDTFLKTGGFPEVLKKDSPGERRQLLQNYYQTIFYRDIVERYNIRAKSLMEGMMACCLHQFSSLFSLSAFEKGLKNRRRPGSRRTLANYLAYLTRKPDPQRVEQETPSGLSPRRALSFIPNILPQSSQRPQIRPGSL
jgi:predicted AAA+ superfamily ATPase